MRSLVVFFTLAKLAAAQLGLSDNEVQPLNMPQITRLDVDCAKTGMTVNIEFSAPFNGVIFSKGFYANPSCRYVGSNSNNNLYNFLISMTDCGTTTYDEDGTLGFQNTIIIQMEEIVQEAWDVARRISCDWKSTFEKEVVFNPIQVGMLNVEEVRFSGDNVECWMDIKRGDPFGSTVDGILEIGEELSVVVYAKDGGSDFDILVKNCYAYDDTNYDSPDTTKLALINDRGCLLKEKLMGYFFRTRDTRETGANIIAYARLNAFKFPDKMGVYLTCDVELCKGGCKDFCEDPGYPTEISESLVPLPPTQRPIVVTSPPIISVTTFECTPGSLDPRCTTTTEGTTTTQFVCTPGSFDPRCAPDCFPGSADPRCPPPPPEPTQFVCTPGSLDPRCTTTTERIITTQFVCTPGSLDPRCPPNCYPGNPDPRCPPPPPPPVPTEFFCQPGSLDPRCERPTIGTTPPAPFVCTPGSLDPRCPPVCTPGSTDPRCPPPPPPPVVPTRPPPPPRPIPTQFVCQPGSLDPRCTQRPVPTRPAPTAAQPTQGHYGGSKDPMYHSFHKWMYEPAPSRFTRRMASPQVVRRKRQVLGDATNATISFTQGFAVLSATDLAGVEGDSVHLFQNLRASNHICIPPVSLALGLLLCVTAILVATSVAAIQYARSKAMRQEKA